MLVLFNEGVGGKFLNLKSFGRRRWLKAFCRKCTTECAGISIYSESIETKVLSLNLVKFVVSKSL